MPGLTDWFDVFRCGSHVDRFGREVTITPSDIDAAGAIASHRFVYMDSNGKAKQADGPNGALLGTSELAYSTGDRADIVMDGIVEVQAGSNVSIGSWLTSDENGKVVTA